MAREPLSNIGFVCEKHSTDERKLNAKKKPEEFLGKFVKLGFPTNLTGPKDPKTERMWVKIDKVVDGKLQGILDNDPVIVTDVGFGDRIECETHEILESMD